MSENGAVPSAGRTTIVTSMPHAISCNRMREIAGCDDRVLRVDARDACFDDYEFIEQVLAEEARNGHSERASEEQAGSP